MKFSYKGKTKEGEMAEGVIDADSELSAARELRAQNIVPLSIKKGKGDKGKISMSLFGSIKLHEKLIFAKNLAGMITAGLALNRAIEILNRQSVNKKFKTVLTDLENEIAKGGTLSGGMKKHPKVFSTLFVSMVSAGEESGNLPSALVEVSGNLEKIYALNKKIKSALTYPMVILFAIFLMATLMMIFVVPTLVKTFEELGAELPGSTQLIITTSKFISGSPFLFIAIVFGVIGGFVFLLKMKRLEKYFDYFFLHLPIFGNMIKQVNAARTARTLSSLLISGVDITRSLSITREVVQNVYFKRVVDEAIVKIQKGVPLSEPFRTHTELYPIMFGEMMAVGEETGNISKMLSEIADFYEAEVDDKTKNLSTIIEPMLMVFIGGAVGFFAVSMLTPMYSILNSI
jgi:type IV pilus assembly protein PilC